MEEDWLKKILDDDDLGLLKVKPKSGAPTADQHLINKFNELNEFVDLHKREPNSSMSNVSEFMLHKRLASIISNADQCAALKDRPSMHMHVKCRCYQVHRSNSGYLF
jgi:hypothetical protein